MHRETGSPSRAASTPRPAVTPTDSGSAGEEPGPPPRLATPARWLATGFGTGYLWPAPGTWGSLLGLIAFAAVLASAAVAVQALACAVVTLLGVWAAQVTAARLGEADPSRVVVDEVAGMWIAMVGIDAAPAWAGWGLAFLLFRVFDIVKPFPARRLEDLPGGLGIMLDDVVAGLYSQLALRLLLIWWGP